MSLTSSQKKVIGLSVVILVGIIELLFLAVLLGSFTAGRTAADTDPLSFLFVIGIFLFPLTWGFRLWRSGVREVSRAQTPDGELITPIRADVIVRIQAKVELSEYRKLIFKLAYTQPVYLYIHFMGILMLVLSWPNIRESWFALFIIFLILYLPIGVYRNATSNYKATKTLHEAVSYEFTPETIAAVGESCSSTMQWKSLCKFRETKEWMLLYANKQVAILIPKKAFASVEEMEAFRNMARVVPV